MKKPSPFADQTFIIDGLAAVGEYVRHKPSALLEVRAEKRLMPDVAALLKKHDVRVTLGERANSDKNSDAAPVVARVALSALPLSDFEQRIKGRERDVIVALDHITDPRNLGAIARTAAFFGIREVLVPERRQVLLTQSAVNTAQGGFALTDLVCVVNLGRTLKALKDDGYWIIGTDMEGEPQKTVAASKYDKLVLVMGSEDVGLSKGIRDACDRLAMIPGRTGGLESLNVSVAAGIVLAEFCQGL